MQTAVFISFILLFLSLVLILIRFVKGPRSVDRILCLDLVSLVFGGFFILHSIQVGDAVYVDATLALVLIAFFGTIIYARYIEKKGKAV